MSRVRDPLAGYGSDDDLEFIESGPVDQNGRVHILARGDAVEEVGLGDAHMTDLINLAVGRVRAICGIRIDRHRGGYDIGGRRTGQFADDRLCIRCIRTLGDQAWRAFLDRPESDRR